MKKFILSFIMMLSLALLWNGGRIQDYRSSKVMKKLNKLLTLIIVICAFCCIPKQIANAKESYPQISMGKVYTGTITNKNVNDRYILKVAKTGTVYFDMNVSDAVSVCIYDKNGNKLNPWFFCGYGDEPFNIQVDAGTYYVEKRQKNRSNKTRILYNNSDGTMAGKERSYL